MIEIYFDDLLLNDDCYADIANSFKLFDDSFFLGSTSSNQFKIQIPINAIENIPQSITVKIDNEDYASLIVDNYTIKNKNMLELELTDKMTLFNFQYDMSTLVPCTVKDIIQNICLMKGVNLATTSFINSNVLADFFDNSYTAREYISFIAELNGGYAIMGKDGKLYLKQFKSTPIEINIEDCEDFELGEHHKIERVVFDNGILKFETSQDEELETLYLNSENPFITTEEIFNNIANEILGFEFYSANTNNCIINPDIVAGDLIEYIDGENHYISIAQYDLDYNGQWIGGYSLNIDSKHQQETKQQGYNTLIKNLKVRLDRDEPLLNITAQNTNSNSEKISSLEITTQGIQQTVEEQTSEQNQKISQVVQTVNEINSKIGDIADITISGENNYGMIELDNINVSEPITIKIHPIEESIAYLYPRNNLYPSSSLFMKGRTLRFENKTTGDIIDYELPDDLWYISDEIYDELIIDYDTHICEINKRVKINEDGTLSALEAIKTEEYDYPSINLEDGDYKISLLGYNTAYLFIRLMAQNIYTTQFATRAEMHSSIDQKANEINLEVKKKVNDDEVIAAINLTSEEAKINADKISLFSKVFNLTADNASIESNNFSVTPDGVIKSLGGIIGGWHIEPDKLWCEITPAYDYNDSDLNRAQSIIEGQIQPTPTDIAKYDFYGEGINLKCLLVIRKLTFYRIGKSNPGKLLLDTSDWFKPIKFINGNGESIAWFGPDGVVTKNIT